MTPRRLAPLALLALVALAFWPSLSNGFVNWDDPGTIIRNIALDDLNGGSVLWALRTTHYGHFQPLAWLSLGLDRVIFGLDPRGYHFVALLLHIFSSVLLLKLVLSLLSFGRPERRDDLFVSFLAAALWAVHPQRVEAVAWATERREMLSTCFLLLSANLYVYAVKDDKNNPSLGAALISFVLAGLSKVTVFTFPALLLVLDVYVLHRPRRYSLLAEKRMFFLAAAAVLAAGLRAQALAGVSAPLSKYGIGRRLHDVIFAPGFYLKSFLYPFDLSPLVVADLSREPRHYLFAALLTFISVAVLFFYSRRHAGVRAFAVALAVLLTPVVGFFRSGPQTAADRFFGWPAIVVSVAVAFGLSGKSRRVLAVAVLALIPVTRAQCHVWHDSVSLWTRALESGPPSAIEVQNMIGALQEAGRAEEIEPWLSYLERELPSDPVALSLRGDTRFEAGDYAGAEALYGRAALVDADLPSLLVKRGVALGRLGRWPEAFPVLLEAVSRFPGDPGAWHNLGLALAVQGRREEAVQALTRALELAPGDPGTEAALRTVVAGKRR